MNNFPAITEEQRQELIAECEADISCARTLMIAAINVNDGETKAKWESQLLRQQVALAALTAKPVAYMYKDRLHSEPRFSSHTRFGNWSQEDINEYEITETKLYTAPPAPVLRVPAGWIKCSDRMPEEHQSTDYVSEEVLVFTSDGEVEISFTDYGRWNCLELVTHWMPLPAPPEASNEQR